MSRDIEEDTGASRLDAIATHWSLIREAHADSRNSIQARQALVLRYARAIRRYLGGIIASPLDADELAQDAVVRLMAGDFGGADPNRGRFRDLLKTAIRNMAHNYWARSSRRRPVELDLSLLGKEADEVDLRWEEAWRQSLLDHAWSALKAHEQATEGSHAYTLLKLRTEFPDCDSQQLADKLGEKTGTSIRADACRQMLRRARIRFAELLVKEVSGGLADASPERVSEELAALRLLEYVRDYLPEE
jgi:RNA polymerase sigma-70 factor (ECF subfamily)